MPTALITGIGGQDGSYLAELLLSKGYTLAGTVRAAAVRPGLLADIPGSIELAEVDLSDAAALENMLRKFRPDEVYNLAARTSGADLWNYPVLTGEVNGLNVTRLLEAIRRVNSNIRFCQASSSEMFGDAAEVPQDEATPLHPRNPYGAAKAYAHWVTSNYRRVKKMFACSAILFNHESPRRRIEFVTRKISSGVARIKLGLATELRLGNLEARRDWGFAGDYADAMWRILQHPVPDEYVIASGQAHSVREFCETAFSHVALDYRQYVTQDPENFRLPETALLLGNAAKAHRLLGWKPKVTFERLVAMMVDSDLKLLENPSCRLTANPALDALSNDASRPLGDA